MSSGFRGLSFGLRDVEFRVYGLQIKVSDLEFMDEGLGYDFETLAFFATRNPHLS